MFKPRHAYKSPVTTRYRGKAKGCPVFNNLIEINSHMVEQHDECLECLAKLKNRTELYRTLADNNKPSNNVIKSLQRLSSSASNNRLKTCLQFLIIKVNEKSMATLAPANNSIGFATIKDNHADATITKDASTTSLTEQNDLSINTVVQTTTTTRHLTKRQKSYHNQNRPQHHQMQQHQSQKHKVSQLASPPQDQVSSTQDQVGPSQDDHDCQTSPPMLSTTHIDDPLVVNIDHDRKLSDKDDTSPVISNKNEEQQTEYVCAQTTQPSPPIKYNALSASTTTNTTIISTSPNCINDVHHHDFERDSATIDSDIKAGVNRGNNKSQLSNKTTHSTSTGTTTTIITNTTEIRQSPAAKRKRTHNSLSSDQETSSLASWSLASYGATSPPSPISSASSTSSISSTSSSYASSFCSSSSCSSSPRHSPSPSPLSTPDHSTDLRTPRLKLNEEKIRKIKKRPVLFDDLYYFSDQPSIASTPTTSSGCSPGQHSNTTQNSDQSNGSRVFGSFACGFVASHMFQAPPSFVNNLKPCSLPPKSQDPPQASVPPAALKVEMINCAICGIKDKPPNISKVYGQNSCILCTKFFATFLKRPQQLYCAQDGDCLMTFDSRCQACWIKICLQKFDIDEEHRKIGHKYSPKLLSSPNVSLITVDTSIVS